MPPKSKGGVAAPKGREPEHNGMRVNLRGFFISSIPAKSLPRLVVTCFWADTRADLTTAPEPELPPPKTVHEQARRRFYLTNPIQQKIDEVGNSWCLQDDERLTWANSLFIDRIASKEHRPSNKVEKEFWKQVAKDNIPFRSLNKDYHWGQDIQARDVGDYTLEEFDARVDKQVRLHQLSLEQGQFIRHRDLVHRGTGNSDSEPCLLTEVDLQRETERRKEMATLKKDLYGHHTESFRLDPQWDDVTPIPAPEDQEATAVTIAYPEDYAEGKSTLTSQA